MSLFLSLLAIEPIIIKTEKWFKQAIHHLYEHPQRLAGRKENRIPDVAVSQQANIQTISQHYHSGTKRNHTNRPPGRVTIWRFHH